jgi:hypothetical protein
MENLNFRPDEHSFVEPWIDPDFKPAVKQTKEEELDESTNKKKETSGKDKKA